MTTTNHDPKGDAGKKKPQLQLIPPALNTETAKALSHGAIIYQPWNWRSNKVEMMTYVGAIRRHLDAFLDGADRDGDSGVHHLGHVAANCAIVLDALQHGTIIDNRPIKKSDPVETTQAVPPKPEWRLVANIDVEPIPGGGSYVTYTCPYGYWFRKDVTNWGSDLVVETFFRGSIGVPYQAIWNPPSTKP